MTRLLVPLVGGFPSSAATVLPVLPVLQLCEGKFVNSLLSIPYVVGSVSTDMDSVMQAPLS